MSNLTKIFDGDPFAALLVFAILVGAMIGGFAVAYLIVCTPALPWKVRRKLPDPVEHFKGEVP